VSSLRQLRGRIKSIGGIKQITRAMEMVATTKLRRFQDRAVASRPYAQEIRGLVSRLAAHLGPEIENEPLFKEGTGERTALLERFDAMQFDYMRSRRSGQSVHPFRMLKELTLLGYFTSEIGCTVAQRYIESPGRFDPCVPYRPGERNWADHA